MMEIEFQPNWKVGDIIRLGDGKSYKIFKKTAKAIDARPYYWWNKLWDRWMKNVESGS